MLAESTIPVTYAKACHSGSCNDGQEAHKNIDETTEYVTADESVMIIKIDHGEAKVPVSCWSDA